MEPDPSTPNRAKEEKITEVHKNPKVDELPEDETPDPSVRRSTRTRQKQIYYGSAGDKSSIMAKGITRKVLKSAFGQKNNFTHIHSLLLNEDQRNLNTLLSQFIKSYYPLFKDNEESNPDVPSLQQAMSGPGKEESLEATMAEIDKLEHFNTRNMKKISEISNGSNMISNIWDLKVKKHPEKRLENFKSRFCKVHQSARFTHKLQESHTRALGRIFKLLKITRNKGLIFNPTQDLKLFFM